MIAQEKGRIRAQVRARLAGVVERTIFSAQVVERLLARPEWNNSQTVLAYVALPDELDMSNVISAAWRSGKRVGLPRYEPASGTYGAAEYRGETLVAQKFGVREPALEAPALPLKQLDLVLVPGVAFDRFGRRLGRGKGFYDRLLAEVIGVKCGVALDEQVVDSLPFEPHDIAVDFVLTPTRWIDARSAGSDDGYSIR
jgi:5-formyltetrahydrofolate cyclo-ligase